ncbi:MULTISPECIES: hypothetical protein [unclassified Clostridium]|uniref:DUF6019 family protein n=1 Tax=unclassified Clostridium TaxID=2614128 RepID=UPI00189B0467|nr:MULTISPECIES: hypothetical protein [unclassified Clostridium]MCR1952793.1 hypothetical protein [Clostridium sp. DSM 100503]
MVYILVGILIFAVLYFIITFAVESGVYYALIKFEKIRKNEEIKDKDKDKDNEENELIY